MILKSSASSSSKDVVKTVVDAVDDEHASHDVGSSMLQREPQF